MVRRALRVVPAAVALAVVATASVDVVALVGTCGGGVPEQGLPRPATGRLGPGRRLVVGTLRGQFSSSPDSSAIT